MDIPYLNLEGPDCKWNFIFSCICTFNCVVWKGQQEKYYWRKSFIHLKIGSDFAVDMNSTLKLMVPLGLDQLISYIFQFMHELNC